MTLVKRKIKDAVKRLDLNLKGKVVLTEAATGAYVVTPVIAALAGAKVFAFTRNTRFGTVDEVKKQTFNLLEQFQQDEMDLTIIDELTPELIAQADIITNSGHLRPLNSSKLKYAKKGAVLPLMYEAWEWRDADLDLDFCRNRDIKIGATNERHPAVDVFNYLGDMALKLIFDAGLCPYRNKFILICNNDFGPFIAKVLSGVCAQLAVCDLEEKKHLYDNFKTTWIGNFPDFEIPANFHDADAVIFTAYPFDKTWIGDNSPVSIKKIRNTLVDPFVLRYAGDIDEQAFIAHEILFYPPKVSSGHMGILPSEIGFDPIINLQAGGLKTGELLLAGEYLFKGEKIVETV